MAKKQDSPLFQQLYQMYGFLLSGTHICLRRQWQILIWRKLADRMEAIHTIEHSADMEKHALLNTLIKAFITPIDVRKSCC